MKARHSPLPSIQELLDALQPTMATTYMSEVEAQTTHGMRVDQVTRRKLRALAHQYGPGSLEAGLLAIYLQGGADVLLAPLIGALLPAMTAPGVVLRELLQPVDGVTPTLWRGMGPGDLTLLRDDLAEGTTLWRSQAAAERGVGMCWYLRGQDALKTPGATLLKARLPRRQGVALALASSRTVVVPDSDDLQVLVRGPHPSGGGGSDWMRVHELCDRVRAAMGVAA